MRVLITGTEGYIGSLMAPLVVAHGHDVTGLDTGYFRDARLEPDPPAAFRVIDKDLRRVTRQDLEGFDAVIHLAGLSNDALGQIYRPVTYDVNHRGSIRLAALAKAAGVTRFLYSSSCSVYGRSADAIVTEESKVDPQTDYALCKMLDEWELTDLADDTFSPTFLRNATAYGASPRMRFDLVVNNLSGLAWTARRIAMLSDGSPVASARERTRHRRGIPGGAPRAARDRAQPGVQCRRDGRELSDPRDRLLRQRGLSRLRDQLRIARTPTSAATASASTRSSGCCPVSGVNGRCGRGSNSCASCSSACRSTRTRSSARGFTRLNQLRHLIDTGQVDANFFWTGR